MHPLWQRINVLIALTQSPVKDCALKAKSSGGKCVLVRNLARMALCLHRRSRIPDLSKWKPPAVMDEPRQRSF
jgi:hypothetical protein